MERGHNSSGIDRSWEGDVVPQPISPIIGQCIIKKSFNAFIWGVHALMKRLETVVFEYYAGSSNPIIVSQLEGWAVAPLCQNL